MKENPPHKTVVTEEKGPLRLISLSDGLFATVLTLLVLDLKIPETLNTSGVDVTTYVHWLGPHLFSYLLTFLVAGTYWLAHHRDFDHVTRYDRGLLSYNLLFLLFIGLLPFTTAAISGGSSQATVFRFFWCVYSANMLVAGVMLALSWEYAVSHHLIAAETPSLERRYIAARHLVTPAVFLLSILVEILSQPPFLGPFILMIIPLIVGWVDGRLARTEPHPLSPRQRRSELLWRLGRIVPWFLVIGLAIWAMLV